MASTVTSHDESAATGADTTLTLEQFEKEARAFLDSHADKRPEETFAWGRGSDSVSLFPERTPEQEAADLAVARAWAQDEFDAGFGWITGPPAYGGRGLPRDYQRAYAALAADYRIPSMAVFGIGLGMVAPTILAHATEEVKQATLRPLYRGDIVGCQLFSEPSSGSDLASLQTRAERDGDEWVVNGSKIWNSRAQLATHEWLCVRTDQALTRHRGISVIMVPIAAPGVEVRPLIAWHDYPTNHTFFTDVRVPLANLIGEVNHGWEYITGALALERAALTNVGDLRRAVDALIAAVSERPAAANAVVRRRIAQLDAEVEATALLGLEAASLLEQGLMPDVQVTVEKVFSSELRQRIADVAVSAFGMDGLRAAADGGAVAGGLFERLYRYAPLNRFGGGTNEVLRDIIAQRGHGLPRASRAPAERK
jgi:alkylation response protein AidB-like acyl-CoA dehydrogenase